MNCPKCATKISKENMNIATDSGQCQSCEHIFKLSENVQQTNINDNFDINKPPKGAWINKRKDSVVVGVKTSSWDSYIFFLVPFTLAWSGGTIGSIYGSQIMTGEFSIFISLFGLPFLAFAFSLWSEMLTAIFGKIELTIDKQGGKIFRGVGMIGRTKVFSWAEVAIIKEYKANYDKEKETYNNARILLEGSRQIWFGSDADEEKHYYLFDALQDIMAKVKANKSIG